nr:splicing factor 3A subunit 2-like [Vicugna pacos]
MVNQPSSHLAEGVNFLGQVSLARTMPSRCHRHSLFPPNPPSLPPSLPTFPFPAISPSRSGPRAPGPGMWAGVAGIPPAACRGAAWRCQEHGEGSRRRQPEWAKRECACVLKEPARSLDFPAFTPHPPPAPTHTHT